MTNTHFIEELKIIESGLSNLTQLLKVDPTVGGLAQLLYERFTNCQADITSSLILRDIQNAESSGTTLSDHEKISLLDGFISIEQATSKAVCIVKSEGQGGTR